MILQYITVLSTYICIEYNTNLRAQRAKKLRNGYVLYYFNVKFNGFAVIYSAFSTNYCINITLCARSAPKKLRIVYAQYYFNVKFNGFVVNYSAFSIYSCINTSLCARSAAKNGKLCMLIIILMQNSMVLQSITVVLNLFQH